MATPSPSGNGHQPDVIESIPLFWAIHDIIDYTGIKFGYDMGLCSPCAIRISDQTARSCITSASLVQGRKVITIDHLHTGKIGEVVQQAWLDAGVAQCDYYQGGQIMSATALLKNNSAPSDEQIGTVMANNVCRYSTYNRVKTVIHNASARLQRAKT